MAVTNTFEGESFVNQTSTLTTPEFIADLFPEFGSEQISAAASQYDGLGTSAFQATAIMGECRLRSVFLRRPRVLITVQIKLYLYALRISWSRHSATVHIRYLLALSLASEQDLMSSRSRQSLRSLQEHTEVTLHIISPRLSFLF